MKLTIKVTNILIYISLLLNDNRENSVQIRFYRPFRANAERLRNTTRRHYCKDLNVNKLRENSQQVVKKITMGFSKYFDMLRTPCKKKK